VRVVELLQKKQLVVDHLLVSLDVLLQDNLDGALSSRTIRLSDNTVGTSTLILLDTGITRL
jgi:hypothetical protein